MNGIFVQRELRHLLDVLQIHFVIKTFLGSTSYSCGLYCIISSFISMMNSYSIVIFCMDVVTMDVMPFTFVFVTEQYFVSMLFTRLWSMRKPLLFDTQNPESSLSQLRSRLNIKPNGKQKWSGDRKWHFCWLVTSLPMYLKSRDLHKFY